MPKVKKAVPKKGKPAKPARDPMNEASHKITLLRAAERTLAKARTSGDP